MMNSDGVYFMWASICDGKDYKVYEDPCTWAPPSDKQRCTHVGLFGYMIGLPNAPPPRHQKITRKERTVLHRPTAACYTQE